MAYRKKTIDDVIRFIEINAPSEGDAVKQRPFGGRRFSYELVEGALSELHAQGKFLDLDAYDVGTTVNIWVAEDGSKNYDLARSATKALLGKLQEINPDKTLAQILSEITTTTFNKQPINKYQTTLGTMLVLVYDGSPYAALKDVIDSDLELAEFRDFEPYNMKCGPLNMWNKKDGSKNHDLAKTATKMLLKKLQKEMPDKTLAQILADVSAEEFKMLPIDKYQTTLGGMLWEAYGGSPYAALKDVIDSDLELAEFRDFQPYDMKMSPKATWTNVDMSKNQGLARSATKALLSKLQEINPDKTLAQILAGVTRNTFYQCPINKYQTTLGGMFLAVYSNSPYAALKDLAENDAEYAKFLPVIETLRHVNK